MGRVLTGTQTTDGNAYTMSYAYNLAGGMTSETYPSGRVVVTEYDTAGRLAGVKKDATNYYAGGAPGSGNALAYTAHGAVSVTRLGNGKWEHTNFNSRLQPTQIGLGASSADSSILRLDYGYGSTNNNGNVLTQTITIGSTVMSQSYFYDALNRLSSATETGAWTQTYDWDRYGNRAVRNTSYIPNPQLTPQSSSPTDFSAFNQATNRLAVSQYDAVGNQTGDALGRSFTYDAENRQITFNGTGGQYFYDGDGRRVKRVVGGVTTIFVYNASGQLIAEYTSDGAPPPAGGGGTSYLTSDHLGSTRVVTKSDGTVKARYDYLPFGEELGANVGARTVGMGYSAADSTRQKFTQKERDNESGLDYFGARYYSSAQARFTSVDPSAASGRPIRPQSWNRYAYVLNNPLRLIDPNGLMDGDPSKPRVVVVVFQGGNLSDSTHTEIVHVKAGGSTEGLGESKIDVEAPHIAQQIKNDFPDADVVLAGPHTTSQLTNELGTNKPDHIIIEGFSAGGVAAIGLTNNLTNNGQSVDQLITVDPRTGPGTTGSVAGIKNPGSVGEATNYFAPGFKDAVVFGPAIEVKGAQNLQITEEMKQKETTVINHNSADDVTSRIVIGKIEDKLKEIK